MLNPDKKKQVQNELADAPQLDAPRLEQLFADLYAIQDKEVARFIKDCLACNLGIMDMKRLALIRGFTSNKEVLLAYEIANGNSRDAFSHWIKTAPIIWKNDACDNKGTSKSKFKDFKDYLNVLNKTYINTQSENLSSNKPALLGSDNEEMARIAYEFCYFINKKEPYIGLNKMLDLEEVIKQSPKYSFLYACNVLEAPWPEAEKSIQRDGFWWGKYTSLFKKP